MKICYMHALVDVNPIKLLGYSHDIVMKSQIYAMIFTSWHSKGIFIGPDVAIVYTCGCSMHFIGFENHVIL